MFGLSFPPLPLSQTAETQRFPSQCGPSPHISYHLSLAVCPGENGGDLDLVWALGDRRGCAQRVKHIPRPVYQYAPHRVLRHHTASNKVARIFYCYCSLNLSWGLLCEGGDWQDRTQAFLVLQSFFPQPLHRGMIDTQGIDM